MSRKESVFSLDSWTMKIDFNKLCPVYIGCVNVSACLTVVHVWHSCWSDYIDVLGHTDGIFGFTLSSDL